MRASRSRFPKAKTIALTAQLLAALLPSDKAPAVSWHESERGHTSLRLCGAVGKREWYVDIYSEKYMCVRVSDRFTTICNSVPSLVFYLRRMLGRS